MTRTSGTNLCLCLSQGQPELDTGTIATPGTAFFHGYSMLAEWGKPLAVRLVS